MIVNSILKYLNFNWSVLLAVAENHNKDIRQVMGIIYDSSMHAWDIRTIFYK